MTNLELITKIAGGNTISESEEQGFTTFAKRLFPNLKCVCGIAYVEGHGTMEYPPMSIHSLAGVILEAVNKKK